MDSSQPDIRFTDLIISNCSRVDFFKPKMNFIEVKIFMSTNMVDPFLIVISTLVILISNTTIKDDVFLDNSSWCCKVSLWWKGFRIYLVPKIVVCLTLWSDYLCDNNLSIKMDSIQWGWVFTFSKLTSVGCAGFDGWPIALLMDIEDQH